MQRVLSLQRHRKPLLRIDELTKTIGDADEFPVAFPTPYSRISVEPRADGLALIYEFVPPSSLIAKTTVALMLKWPEVIVIAALAFVAGLLLRFRKAISASWFVADSCSSLFACAVTLLIAFVVRHCAGQLPEPFQALGNTKR